jgi:molybdopterin/thiamine biosynthesis adenylyltransferase
MTTVKEIELASNSHSQAATAVPLSARLPNFIGAPPAADEKLRGLKVVVVGCGAVGGPIALGLARLQIHTLCLVDKGKFKAESMLTHLVFPEDIPGPKASILGRRVKHISPDTKVIVFDGPLESLDLAVIAEADLAVLATDNLLAEIEVGQRCLWLGLPLVHAAVHGETLVAQVRFFANRPNGPCPACGYSPAEWKAMNRQTRYSCEAVDRRATRAETKGPPTVSVSFLCSMAADLALVQILRHTLGLGSAVENCMLQYCGFDHRTITSALKRNLNCPCDHTVYGQATALEPIPDFTLSELAQMAGYDSGSGLNGVSLQMGRLSFCESAVCRCTAMRPFRRFLATGARAARCRSCGEKIVPLPFYTHNPVPASVIADRMERPLRDLGAESAGWVKLRGPQGNMLFYSHKQKGKSHE